MKSAYRALAKVMHPDAGGTAGTFRLLQVAYETLTTPLGGPATTSATSPSPRRPPPPRAPEDPRRGGTSATTPTTCRSCRGIDPRASPVGAGRRRRANPLRAPGRSRSRPRRGGPREPDPVALH
ncbi:J domain-containing protein, partial [Kutzneria sp. 744]|uniref:J domain-containing protein n=1 Tax=Kutzneria sp. (strain 744) TaxID=345341 RepID=UPI00350E8F2C